MRVARTVIGSVVILAWTTGSMAILVEDYVAIRLLDAPSPHPPVDCDWNERRVTCGAGPAFPAGISNQGDIAGHLQTQYPHSSHFEEGIRWLRSTGYAAENVSTYSMAEGEVNDKGGPLPFGRAFGIHSRFVTANGMMVGASNVANSTKYSYDIVNDKWYDFGKGGGVGANNNGKVLSLNENCCGGHVKGYYPRVSHIDLVHEPFTVAERGELWRLPAGSHPLAINDDDMIVGWFDPTCYTLPGFNPFCFGGRLPMKIEPVGENEWGDPIALDELVPDSESSRVISLSNTNPAFGIGPSKADDGFTHGVLWNVNSGQIIADFGPLTNVYRINSAGTMVIGTQQGAVFPPTQEPRLWWTEDGWESFETLDLHDVLEEVNQDGLWDQIIALRGINDSGQIVGMGTLVGEFGALPDPTVTGWTADLTMIDRCVHPTDGPCGIPFILDTLPLGLVLKGDVNNDGSVDNLDITPFIAALSAEDEAAFLAQFPNGNYAAADIDMSDRPDNLDITPFIGLLTAADTTAVPEPSSIACAVLALMMGRRRSIMR